MKINIVSHSDISGGAARAAYRLHRALIDNDFQSRMLVKQKISDDYTVIPITPAPQYYLSKVVTFFSSLLLKLQRTKNPVLHSANFFGSKVYHEIQSSDADVINLHWINFETLSIKQIGQINKPIVMTLHDMWAFCGGEHYCNDNTSSRFRLGYEPQNKQDISPGIDLNRLIWSKKMKKWEKKFTIVTPSTWLSQCARDSKLFSGWDIHTIPNALNTDVFKPVNKIFARDLLNLPLNKKIIGFGAIGGGSDPRKGFDLLQDALNKLSSDESSISVVFGQSTPENIPELALPLLYIGRLYDDETLALLYNAIDVMVVPSRQENLPQTATEAQACGCPVVSFNSTGFPDAIEHKITGYLAKPFDTQDLAYGIEWCLTNNADGSLSQNCRDRAVSLWSFFNVANQYAKLYERLIISS